jgi:hypothetical protein
MPGLFSFISKEWGALIAQPFSILPGIEKISAIYWSEKERDLMAITYDRDGNKRYDHAGVEKDASLKIRLQKFRSPSIPYSWIKIEDSPLAEIHDGQVNHDLFSELQNTILVLRYRNDTDGKYDAILVYFNKNLNQFGVSISDRILSTENKSIISNILYHYFKKILSDAQRNYGILQSLQQSVFSLSQENDKLKKEAVEVASKLEDMLVNLAYQQIGLLADKYQKEFTLSDDAIKKLKSFKGNLSHIPAIIEKAVIFSVNLVHLGNEGIAIIDASMISLDDYQVTEEATSILKRIDSRESKTIQLLDRLERSAISLKSKGQPLTGVNVGKYMQPPITAPAISDALKKHRTTIVSLMRKYPGKWDLLREEFRPVRNLFRKEKELKGKEGIA